MAILSSVFIFRYLYKVNKICFKNRLAMLNGEDEITVVDELSWEENCLNYFYKCFCEIKTMLFSSNLKIYVVHLVFCVFYYVTHKGILNLSSTNLKTIFK